MKRAGRILAFLVALGAVVGAVGSVIWFVGRSRSTGGGGISIGLCGLSSPDRMLIEAYLEANADQLEQPAGADDTPVAFVIEPGETVAEIGERLERERLISDAELFRRYVQYHGLDAGIEAGEFTLRQTMTIPQIAEALQQGMRPEQAITIPEGLRLEQIAVAVEQQTGIPQAEFLVLAKSGWRDAGLSYSFLADLPPDATLEGFLLPETYRLPENPTTLDVLDRMLETFGARVTPEMRAAAASQGLDVYQMVTLASIVEREAVLDDERPLIAGVYYNRLNDGWYLGADPTVQYPLGTPADWWPQLTLEQMETDSPYNTYKNLGLPPGPICSPGLASIQATAYPTQTDYYFFLADCAKNDGSHLFARTIEEHNANYAMCGGEVP